MEVYRKFRRDVGYYVISDTMEFLVRIAAAIIILHVPKFIRVV